MAKAGKGSDLERFWSFVKRKGTCWEWTGGLDQDGYGIFHIGKSVRAHRWFYARMDPTLEPDQKVLHTCDNPRCVNPDHLFKGTSADNSRDMVLKGRSPRGITQHTCKNTEAEIIEIRVLFKEGKTLKELSKMFKLYEGTIWCIVKGKSWTHVGGPISSTDMRARNGGANAKSC